MPSQSRGSRDAATRKGARLTLTALDAKIDAHRHAALADREALDSQLEIITSRIDELRGVVEHFKARHYATLWGRLRWLLTGR